MEPLTEEDLYLILRLLFPSLDAGQLKSMVQFNSVLCNEVQTRGLWGHNGAPWEFNLRDMCRWADMVIRHKMVKTYRIHSSAYLRVNSISFKNVNNMVTSRNNK